nr:hypothetical protein [Tanacetum cinerariifolium]
MIPEPGDTERDVNVNETFYEQTDDELFEKELKQIEADDQAIQTILLGLPEDIYAAVDSCETAQEIWLRVQQMMKGSDIGIQEKKAKLCNERERFTSNERESIESYYHPGSESRPPMLNKENYVPWSSRLLRRMIAEPGDDERDVNVNETFHEQTDDELSERELKQIEADDQAIQTILLGLPEDIYAVVDSCEIAQEIWLRTKDLHTADYTQLYDFLKYNQKEVDELKAKRIAKIQDPFALMANSSNPYASPAPHQDLSPLNQNFLQQPITYPEDITDPTTAMNMALALMAKAFKLNYSTLTNNNQRISSNPRNRQIAQPGQNAGNLNGYNAVQNVRNQVAKNPRVQNDGIQNQIGNGNLVAVRAEGNIAGHTINQIRLMQMVGGNGGNQFRQYARQNAGNLN